MAKVSPPPATASWQKGRVSGPSGDCVQVVRSQTHVWVRDSKNPLGPVLGFASAGWAAFIAGVRCDEFDRARVLA